MNTKHFIFEDRQDVLLSGMNIENSYRITPKKSDMLCTGTERRNRLCKVKNLCFETKEQRFFILKEEGSSLINVPAEDCSKGGWKELVDETTQENHYP